MARNRDTQSQLEQLVERGVEVVDPRQTYVHTDIELDRIQSGVVLFPGTSLYGKRTFIGAGAQLATEGPLTLRDAVVGRDSVLGGGFIQDSVLMGSVALGGNVHIRRGSLLEEEVSIGHSVGLKQTVLLSFVTLGSLINFCDALMAGGRSRRDHSEVGSGFIHFNFTPRGRHGDKATASLFGDVVDGVMLDQSRIFLGGAAGAIGPVSVGFGTVTAAGQILRRDIGAEKLVLDVPAKREETFDGQLAPDRVDHIWQRNADYVSQLCALESWYREVRRPRAAAQTSPQGVMLVDEGIDTIRYCINERLEHLRAFLGSHEHRLSVTRLVLAEAVGRLHCPISAVFDTSADHVHWVQQLDKETKDSLRSWLAQVAASVRATIYPTAEGM